MSPLSHRNRKKSDLELLHREENQARKSRLLQILLGPGTHEDSYSDTYFQFLVAQITAFDTDGNRYRDSFASVLDLPDPPDQDVILNEILSLVENFGKAIRDEGPQQGQQGKKMSLDGLLDSALRQRGRALSSLDFENTKKAYQTSFAIVGWLSMLYEPSRTIKTGLLSISIPGQTVDTVASRNIASAKRSLSTILNEFGQSLPIVSTGDVVLPLHVNSLTFHALSVIGKVRIIWSSDLCAHLQFNTTNRTLVLFKLPSFCALCCLNEDPCGLISEILRDLLQHKGITLKGMMQEILLSYRIIFGQSRVSRKLYLSRERLLVREAGFSDQLLDLLCGESQGKLIRALPPDFWPDSCLDGIEKNSSLLEQSVYNNKTDFPIFGMRLKELGEFSSRQRPSVLKDIWTDRRDPLQWYTFWAVFWIGGLSLLFSMVQIGLAGAQVYYAQHPAAPGAPGGLGKASA